jgi:hypothetical protein
MDAYARCYEERDADAAALGEDGLCREFREWWNTSEVPLD